MTFFKSVLGYSAGSFDNSTFGPVSVAFPLGNVAIPADEFWVVSWNVKPTISGSDTGVIHALSGFDGISLGASDSGVTHSGVTLIPPGDRWRLVSTTGSSISFFVNYSVVKFKVQTTL